MNSINPFDIILNSDIMKILNSLDIEKNIFRIKFNLMKFNIWSNLNEKIKLFYENTLKQFIKVFNKVINLKEFKLDKFNKIHNQYFYNDIPIDNNQEFLYFELKNNFIHFYLDYGEIKFNCIDKNNRAFLNLINMNIFDIIYKFYDMEITNYTNKLIEFKKIFVEIE